MARSRAEIVLFACEELGEVGIGQSPSPEVRARVDAAVVGVISDLRIDGITLDPDASSGLPDEVAQHLALILAAAVAGRVGVVGEEAVTLEAKAERARERLRRLFYYPAGSRPVRVSYF